MSEPIQSIATNNYLLATPIGSGYMETSALEYDGDKISGYAGSAFKAGDEFPQSATEAIEVITGTSATWNGTTDTVSSNSGAWGGSALPVSAGPGIKVNLVDNTLVFSNDETVLFNGDISNYTALSGSITASENLKNFETIKIDYTMEKTTPGWAPIETRQFTMNQHGIADNSFYLNLNSTFIVTNDTSVERLSRATFNNNVLTIVFDSQRINTGNLEEVSGTCHILGITGINRIATGGN